MTERPNAGDRDQRIRVDSIAEEYAYVEAYPSAAGTWQILSQILSARDGGPVDLLEVQDTTGARRQLAFDVGSFFGKPGIERLGVPTTQLLDHLMRVAEAFARENGPQHPGSVPRFPVPSARFPGKLDVPMAVLAVDEQGRGLFAPPRVVTLDPRDGTAYGVGEFPGFDPASWPPPRAGDWPPAGVAGMTRDRLAGVVARFSAVALRLHEVWNGAAEPYPQLDAERAEYLGLLSLLDPPGMVPYYRRLAPAYWSWLDTTPSIPKRR